MRWGASQMATGELAAVPTPSASPSCRRLGQPTPPLDAREVGGWVSWVEWSGEEWGGWVEWGGVGWSGVGWSGVDGWGGVGWVQRTYLDPNKLRLNGIYGNPKLW